MIHSEWAAIAAEIQARWPHVALTDSSMAVWFDDLQHLPAEQVRSAVLATYRDGREFPPNGAQILAKVIELSDDEPDYDEAWSLFREAVRRFGGQREPEAIEWLRDRSPLIAAAAERFGFRDYCYSDSKTGATQHAQFRDIFRAARQREEREQRYAGLPDAGLPVLNRRKPRQLGEAIKELLPAEGGSA